MDLLNPYLALFSSLRTLKTHFRPVLSILGFISRVGQVRVKEWVSGARWVEKGAKNG